MQHTDRALVRDLLKQWACYRRSDKAGPGWHRINTIAKLMPVRFDFSVDDRYEITDFELVDRVVYKSLTPHVREAVLLHYGVMEASKGLNVKQKIRLIGCCRRSYYDRLLIAEEALWISWQLAFEIKRAA